MSNNLKFNIQSGSPPFNVDVVGSDISTQIYDSTGEKTISDIPNGIYTLKIIDSNGCVFEEQILVDPSITTTTTTSIPSGAIMVGNINEELLIFNSDATNINTLFTGYPDPDVITSYLWFKTYDGSPLNNQTTLQYTISSGNGGTNSEFEFISLSDQIHTEVVENIGGPSTTINGNIILKENFIETYFEFTYFKSSTTPDFYIEINSLPGQNTIFTDIKTKDDLNTTYGVYDPISNNEIIITYGLLPT
ncbi:MAG: hypothetical protein ACOC33_01115 [bacterium]